jgi:hypothetical protein
MRFWLCAFSNWKSRITTESASYCALAHEPITGTIFNRSRADTESPKPSSPPGSSLMVSDEQFQELAMRAKQNRPVSRTLRAVLRTLKATLSSCCQATKFSSATERIFRHLWRE